MMPQLKPPTQNVIGFPVTSLSFNDQMDWVLEWAAQRLSKTVCVANVHMLMEATWNQEFGSVLSNSDMVTPDGMPLVWLMSWMGRYRQDRVAGMDIILGLCERSPSRNVSIFFLGSDANTLQKMRQRLRREFPNLEIAGMEPLPFRPLTPQEDEDITRQINESGAGIVMVSLGCPKQETWMNAHKGKVNAVMIGLGGAFPVYAGVQKWAPEVVRRLGFEWLYRLIQEPGRLWKRYARTIPPFAVLALLQVVSTLSREDMRLQTRGR
jgi:N-acetylglucosaminyldiphosphoundecaprenol N-acetyl-beta-D-mannosaminyltransferase